MGTDQVYTRNQGRLPAVVRENRSVTVTVAFAVVCGVCAVVADALGFPLVGAMIVAYAAVMILITAVFVVLPIYAMGLVD